jgi:outer membrane protein assembly factor BamE (lipoprotein component of BamABCDE complex)
MKFTIAILMLTVLCLAGCSSTKTHSSPPSWNSVKEGMSRPEIVRLIGQPTSPSSSTDIWKGEGWDLHVTYDQSGRAINVLRMRILQ